MNGFILCDQFCGTRIHFVEGKPFNDRDNKPHVCSKATMAREFEGYYNMIQISSIRQYIQKANEQMSELQTTMQKLNNILEWQEAHNKPLAEAFIKRKAAGRKRNYS
jgi:hypothetical protein